MTRLSSLGRNARSVFIAFEPIRSANIAEAQPSVQVLGPFASVCAKKDEIATLTSGMLRCCSDDGGAITFSLKRKISGHFVDLCRCSFTV